VVGTSFAGGGNLVANPGFESNLAGWTQSSGQTVARVAGGHSGGYSAEITRQSVGTAALKDSPNTVRLVRAGNDYTVSAWVRVKTPRLTVAIRIREVKGGTEVNQQQKSLLLTDSNWHQVSMSYRSKTTGSDLDLNVLGWKFGPHNQLFIDDVSMVGPAGGQPVVTPAPAPAPSKTPTPSPQAPQPTPTVAPTTPAPVPSPGRVTGNTLFGETVWSAPGQSYASSLSRDTATLGAPQMVRVFYPGLPGSWTGPAGLPGRPVDVSFKALPKEILSGVDDTLLSNWFKSAPTAYPVWWTYYHEPEDNIARGEFTAADYRAAWAHLKGLANGSGHTNLHATLVLMSWTLSPSSGRSFSDYYAGGSVIDALGWDGYSAGYAKGTYSSPASIFASSIALSRSLGKPWGVAETGSQMAVGDNGTGRAAWITSMASYLDGQGAMWVAYFNSTTGGEFRLLDAPSITAWRNVLAGNL
jgi:hypothetical protein